jgi:hypothetical protein
MNAQWGDWIDSLACLTSKINSQVQLNLLLGINTKIYLEILTLVYIFSSRSTTLHKAEVQPYGVY